MTYTNKEEYDKKRKNHTEYVERKKTNEEAKSGGNTTIYCEGI
jgi:hypothetical protein